MTNTKNITILDGGMGRELEQRGAPFRQPEWSALALMEAPDTVRETHTAFIDAGAEVITTNAYACIPFHIGADRFEQRGLELISLSAKLARQAADEAAQDVKVAGCVPPLFGSYNPDLFDKEAAMPILSPFIEGQRDDVDFWLIETVSSLEEARFVPQELTKTGKPIWMSFTLRDYTDEHGENAPPQIRSRENLRDVLQNIFDLPIEAVLFNCSEPETMLPAVQLAAQTIGETHQIGVYANAYNNIRKGHQANQILTPIRQDLTQGTDPYLEFCKEWIDAGASIIGGCCGIGPTHIKAISALKNT